MFNSLERRAEALRCRPPGGDRRAGVFIALGAAFALAVGLAAAPARAHAPAWADIGRPATAQELKAWDIDVRADFKGLPAGSGSVARGQEVWEAKCASCHGVFGESGEVFNPVIGGTTAADVRSGRVARLTDGGYPGRTTLMKLSTLSTLWDYIHRAMPWTQPKSLSPDEVYAATAFMLNLAGIVADDFVLSDKNIAETQKLMPNRLGMTTQHALWPGREFGGAAQPDVQGSACMANCTPEPKIASFLPDFARDAHGNLAQQNRLVGAQRGADTRRSEAEAGNGAAAGGSAVSRDASAAAPAPASGAVQPKSDASAALALTQQHNCMACHDLAGKRLGPSFRDVSQKYAGQPDAATALRAKIKVGGVGTWGSIPMPAQSLSEADALVIAQWLAAGARQP